MSEEEPSYSRVLVKISGGFLGTDCSSLNREKLDIVARQIRGLLDTGVEVCMVTGGGNLLRGASDTSLKLERTCLDRMGMLGTAINGLALAGGFEKHGIGAQVMSAVSIQLEGIQSFDAEKAIGLMSDGKVPIFVAGTGLPYFSTDTGAVVRALQVKAELLIKASRVDGVYDSDPEKNEAATRFDRISYQRVLDLGLTVMDQSAIALCRDNALPLAVVDLGKKNILADFIDSPSLGTLIVP